MILMISMMLLMNTTPMILQYRAYTVHAHNADDPTIMILGSTDDTGYTGNRGGTGYTGDTDDTVDTGTADGTAIMLLKLTPILIYEYMTTCHAYLRIAPLRVEVGRQSRNEPTDKPQPAAGTTGKQENT